MFGSAFNISTKAVEASGTFVSSLHLAPRSQDRSIYKCHDELPDTAGASHTLGYFDASFLKRN